MNPTAEKFGYPGSVVNRFERWVVLVRPVQPTLGSLVLVCNEPATEFSKISDEAAAEIKPVVREVERVLSGAFQYDKINYLMLMMVDPDVHFHVIPRYEGPREYGGVTFADESWPGPPDITAANHFPDEVKIQLIDDLRARFG